MERYAPQNEEMRRFRTEAAALVGLSESIPLGKTDDPVLAAALADARLDSSWSYFSRGSILANLGQWYCADKDFTKAIELGPPSFRFWYSRALERLATDDRPGFQAACADMLKQLGKTGDPETAYFVAWTCSLAPDALGDVAPAVRLAEHAARINPHCTQYLQGLGAILYRAGRFDEAVRRLEEVDLLEKQGGSNFSRACTGSFLAMAHHRLHHAAEARKQLDAARDQTVKALGDERGSTKPDWKDRVTSTLVRREAEALVGKQATPASQSADRKTKGKN
jgi:tetratricopeptide (TPR) repeat protein